MDTELQQQLPVLISLAADWARQQERLIAQHGFPLPEQGLELARGVGVRQPVRVRIQVVPEIPMPDHPALLALSKSSGLGGGSVGLTLGYGIYVKDGHLTTQLVSHELRHVHQCEILGGIDWFMAVYLPQVAILGYREAPLERDLGRPLASPCSEQPAGAACSRRCRASVDS